MISSVSPVSAQLYSSASAMRLAIRKHSTAEAKLSSVKLSSSTKTKRLGAFGASTSIFAVSDFIALPNPPDSPAILRLCHETVAIDKTRGVDCRRFLQLLYGLLGMALV